MWDCAFCTQQNADRRRNQRIPSSPRARSGFGVFCVFCGPGTRVPGAAPSRAFPRSARLPSQPFQTPTCGRVRRAPQHLAACCRQILPHEEDHLLAAFRLPGGATALDAAAELAGHEARVTSLEEEPDRWLAVPAKLGVQEPNPCGVQPVSQALQDLPVVAFSIHLQEVHPGEPTRSRADPPAPPASFPSVRPPEASRRGAPAQVEWPRPRPHQRFGDDDHRAAMDSTARKSAASSSLP